MGSAPIQISSCNSPSIIMASRTPPHSSSAAGLRMGTPPPYGGDRRAHRGPAEQAPPTVRGRVKIAFGNGGNAKLSKGKGDPAYSIVMGGPAHHFGPRAPDSYTTAMVKLIHSFRSHNGPQPVVVAGGEAGGADPETLKTFIQDHEDVDITFGNGGNATLSPAGLIRRLFSWCT